MPKHSIATHKTRVLILSAYDADSHQAWRKSLIEGLGDIEWVSLSLPARYFSWRVRGNSLSWAFDPESREILEAQYDLLIATSMVDLSALRGFVPSLAQVPTVVYFHENQFSYPENSRQHSAVEPQLLSLYSALCADRLWFNSNFNRQSFFSGAQQLLKKLPDCVPKGLIERLEARSEILPVPLLSSLFSAPRAARELSCGDGSRPWQLVWNHRWEHDKAPDRLLACAKALIERGFSFQLHVLGQSFRKQPCEFDQLKALLEANDSLGQWGFLNSKDEYLSCLAQADFVLSSALHDFQGLAILEAVALGCLPVLPNRQVYPEWFEDDFLYQADADIKAEADNMAETIIALTHVSRSAPSVSSFDERQLLRRYREAIQALVN